MSGLSRDTANALNKLDKIFDKKTVQEKQELSKLFMKEGFNLIGGISTREKNRLAKAIVNATSDEERNKLAQEYQLWEEGGANKVLLHALFGGLAAYLGGGDFASGAEGAGFNEYFQSELAKIKNPALHQLASYLIGSTAAKLLGGDAQTGGSTAWGGTTYNFLSDWQTAQRDAAINKARETGDWSAVEWWNAIDVAQDKILDPEVLKQLKQVGIEPEDITNNETIMGPISKLAEYMVTNPNLPPGDYDGFKILPDGNVVLGVVVGTAVGWMALNTDWNKLTLGLPVVAGPGRTVANTLSEKLAMEQAISNPGSGVVLNITMKDPRWPASQGWVKMAQNINGIEIHYIYNKITQVYTDFKFVD